MTPEIALKPGTYLDLNQPIFHHATDGRPGQVRTNVRLLVEDGHLTVDFECLDDPHYLCNTYTEHNTDLWRQEVFEVFIAAGEEPPSRYLELEINPNNAFFAAWVENISGQAPEKLTMLGHASHKIRHKIVTGEKQWSGQMIIPLELLGNQNETNYRLNFYRIVLRDQPLTSEWECSPENCDFLCWSPTHSGTEPAFHRPAYFGTLRIDS